MEDRQMKRNLTGRRMLITGASSGIGRCLAEQAALGGARLALAARSADKLEGLARALRSRGVEAIPITADVTQAADRKRILATVTDQWGGLDVLVNNAGVASFGHFAGSSEEILRQVMAVNFFAPAELIRLAIPILTMGQQPAIVNVASMCGRRGLPAWPEYSASKFALCGLTEALRGEMARFDIDVLLIVPGLTRSDLHSHFLRNEGRMQIDFDAGMPPAVVAEGILKALAKNRTETVLGREAKVILRLNRFFPDWVDWMIKRRVRKLYEETASQNG
jgi:short-subunit dehydrogenase